MDFYEFYSYKRKRRAKLIFNPGSGVADDSPHQLLDVIEKMQVWNLMPEVYLIKPGCDLENMVREAFAQGITLFVACGGDGTVSSLARALTGKKSVTMGIIPTGTQNNIARSLQIPEEISQAIALLRRGRRIRVDSGIALCNETEIPFFEICSVGLMSAIFPSADDIQHGKYTKIGDLLSTLAATRPSTVSLQFDNGRRVRREAHVVLVSNMPYVGPRYRVGLEHSFKDGLLDVTVFSDLSKLDLLGCAIKRSEGQEDPRIEHFLVRKALIEADPPMSVMADGITVGEGKLAVEICKKCLAVMTGISVMEYKGKGDNRAEKKKR